MLNCLKCSLRVAMLVVTALQLTGCDPVPPAQVVTILVTPAGKPEPDTPARIVVDERGMTYWANHENHTIVRIDADATTVLLAGMPGVPGHRDGPAHAARFDSPRGVAVDRDARLWIADTGNHVVRMIDRDGSVRTVAGSAGMAGFADGRGETVRFNKPTGIGLDIQGNVLISDSGNHTLRAITPDGTVRTVAGVPGARGHYDGTGVVARFDDPQGIAIAGGFIYVADAGSQTLRRVDSSGRVVTVAGRAYGVGASNGRGAAASLIRPEYLAADRIGNVYIGDTGAGRVRAMDRFGFVRTLEVRETVHGVAVDSSGLFVIVAGPRVRVAGDTSR